MTTLIPPRALLALADDPAPATVPFEAPKYGVKASIPKDWPIAAREEEDRVFVALIRQDDPERPGVVACELGLAPENLDEYRTRIEGNAKRAGPAGRKLARNEVVKAPKGDRLETIWEFRPISGGLWRELSVRILANRQMYTFTLNVDDATYAVGSAPLRCVGFLDRAHRAQHRGRPARQGDQSLGPA